MSAQIQQQPQTNLQFNQPVTTPVTHKDENTVVVINIDKFVTESMLHAKFSEAGEIKSIKLTTSPRTGQSLGMAYVEYRLESAVKEAIRKFNMKKFFRETNNPSLKFLHVFPKLSKDTASNVESNKLFVKYNNAQESLEDNIENIYGFLTQFGEIHRLIFRSKKGKLLNYGQITFKDKEGYEKALESNDNSQFSFLVYVQSQKSINIHIIEHRIFCREIPSHILTDQAKLKEEEIKLTHELREYLSKQQYGYLSYSLNIDQGHKKAYIFISVKDKENADKLILDFESNGAIATIISVKKPEDDQYKYIHLKNLKYEPLNQQEKELAINSYNNSSNGIAKDEKIIVQEYINQKIEESISKDLKILQFNDFSIQVKVTDPVRSYNPKPNEHPLPDSRQATIFFRTVEDGKRFIISYQNKENRNIVKTWFVDSNFNGNINILLSSTILEQYKKSKKKGQTQIGLKQQQELSQLYQQQYFEQQQQNYQNTFNVNEMSQFHAASNRYNPRPYSNNQHQPRQFNNNNLNQRTNHSSNIPRYNNDQGNQNQQRRAPYNNSYQGQGQRAPQQGTQNFYNRQPGQGQPQRQQQQPNNFQQQQQGFPQQQQFGANQRPQGQPQPVNSQKPHTNPQPLSMQQAPVQTQQQPMTLEQIQQTVDEFVKKPQEQQKTILGQLIYPKVKQELDSKNEDSKTLTPKITGMLIDFSVFELEDIFEMIQSKDELIERINEALELIKSQKK